MPKTRTRRAAQGPTDSYLALIRKCPLRVIRSDADLDEATAALDGLTSRLDSLDAGERDYLDVLSDLIHAYESTHHAIEPAPDGDILTMLIEDRKINQRELARETGLAVSTISEAVTGRRGVSRHMARKLGEYFRIDPGVFTGRKGG